MSTLNLYYYIGRNYRIPRVRLNNLFVSSFLITLAINIFNSEFIIKSFSITLHNGCIIDGSYTMSAPITMSGITSSGKLENVFQSNSSTPEKKPSSDCEGQLL